MIREERRKKRRRKHILIGFLTTLLILALAALIVIKVFTVKNVEVEGNKLYSDEQIKEWVLNDDYSGIHYMYILNIVSLIHRKFRLLIRWR